MIVINSKKAENISLEIVKEFDRFRFEKEKDTKGKYQNIPAVMRLNTKGRIFISIPRTSKDDIEYVQGTLNYINENDTLTPWPNEENNTYTTGLLQSVVGFEIDLENNVWALNHKDTHCELIIFSSEGKLLKTYSLDKVTNSTSYLTTINIDTKNHFVFISDTQSRNLSDYDSMKNYGVILLNLRTNSTWRELDKTLDENDNDNSVYHPVNMNSITLRCDKRYLFYSTLGSKKLKLIRTTPLRKNQSIEENTTFTFDKHVMSEELLSSARGHFYYTVNTPKAFGVIHQQFYEKDFQFNNIQHIGFFNGSNDSIVKTDNLMMAISMSFSGTSGYLYVLMSRVNRNRVRVRDNGLSKSIPNHGVYRAKVNDRSYLYECNVEEEIDSTTWVIIITLSFVLSSTVIYFIKFLTTSSTSPKLNEQSKGYEEDGILMTENIDEKKDD